MLQTPGNRNPAVCGVRHIKLTKVRHKWTRLVQQRVAAAPLSLLDSQEPCAAFVILSVECCGSSERKIWRGNSGRAKKLATITHQARENKMSDRSDLYAAKPLIVERSTAGTG